MPKLLWIGDAGCGSGFGKATHHIATELLARGYEITALGVNYRGDPHDEPFPIFPAFAGGDILGFGRTKEMVKQIKPDAVVVQTNPWNVPGYLRELPTSEIPTVGIIAVEGQNCEGATLNGLTRAVFWNQFSLDEASAGGMAIPAGIVPLGVDLETFAPGDQQVARDALPLPEPFRSGYIVLNVNRNQYRKRIDLSIQYFAEWVKNYDVPNAYLMLHLLLGSRMSCDCDQLARYYGITDRLILSQPQDIYHGTSLKGLVNIYRSADVFLSTTLGEGHGLTGMEAMAVGLPCILPDFSGYGDWARGAAFLVRCTSTGVMPDVRNMIGGVPDMDATIDVLHAFYTSSDVREAYRRRALACVRQPQYRWSHIGAAFADEIAKVLPC